MWGHYDTPTCDLCSVFTGAEQEAHGNGRPRPRKGQLTVYGAGVGLLREERRLAATRLYLIPPF